MWSKYIFSFLDTATRAPHTPYGQPKVDEHSTAASESNQSSTFGGCHFVMMSAHSASQATAQSGCFHGGPHIPRRQMMIHSKWLDLP